MYKTLTALLTATVLVFTSLNLAATEIKIGAGSATGEYTNTIVPAISEALKEHGYSAVAQISAGSQKNIDDVKAGTVPAGLTQLDVAALNMTAEKDPNESLVLLGGKIAPEALFCATRKDSNIRTYYDLTDDQTRKIRVSVGPQGSGTAKTFEYLMKLDPDLNSIELLYKKNTKVELSRLLSGRRDLVCFVMTPNPENSTIKMVVDNKNLDFITIDNPAFVEAKINNMNVYSSMEVPISGGFLGFSINTKKVKTLVTWVSLIVNENQIESGLLDALATVTLKADLLPKNSIGAKANKLLNDFSKMFQ